MTLPYEQVYALQRTREFLRELLGTEPLLKGRVTAAMKEAIRERAYRCFKHYPSDQDIQDYWMNGDWNRATFPKARPKKKKEDA